MKLQERYRNEHGKCDLPSNTIVRIKDGLFRLNIKPYFTKEVAHSDDLHWNRLYCPSAFTSCMGPIGEGIKVEGKGTTRELAKAGAYAEFVERLSWPDHWGVDLLRGQIYSSNDSLKSFFNYEWISGYRHGTQAEMQLSLSIGSLLAKESYLSACQLETIKNSEIAKHWVNGFSLVENQDMKVPILFVSMISGSNGLASGNNLEEAVVQAACEIFERYAYVVIIRRKIVLPTIDQASIDNAKIHRMMEYYSDNGIDVIIKDATFDGALPTIGVLFINRQLPDNHMEKRIFKVAASFSKNEALTRCLTERMQARDGFKPFDHYDGTVYDRAMDYMDLLKIGICREDISFLEEGERRSFEWADLRGGILSEIAGIVEICKQLGTDCVLVDKTNPTLDFPVVRVIMPKLSDILLYVSRARPFLGHLNWIETYEKRREELVRSFFTDNC